MDDSNDEEGTEVSGCDESLNMDNDPSNANGWHLNEDGVGHDDTNNSETA